MLNLRAVRAIKQWSGWQGLFLAISLTAWTLYAMVLSLTSPYAFEFTSPYMVNPTVLAIGVLVGRYQRSSWREGNLPLLLAVLIIVTLMAAPIYANARAAVGGLLIALAGLAASDFRTLNTYKRGIKGYSLVSAVEPKVLPRAIYLLLSVGLGTWLMLASQAAIVLTIFVAIVIAVALWVSVGPPQWVSVALGLIAAAMAVICVAWLGSREGWPSWLAAREGLSSTRHILWSDALSLWASELILGAGPGAFTPSSELASRRPSLAASHSLVLQTGAELGIVGVLLLVIMFAGGLLLAARGNRRTALIAIAAWTTLAIHSSIDHLEDFPIVTFTAGSVLGWSGVSIAPATEFTCSDE